MANLKAKNSIKSLPNREIPKNPWGFFIYVTLQHKLWAFSAIIAVIIAASLSVSTNYLFKLIIDAVEASDIKSAMMWGLLFPVALLVVQVFFRLSGYFGAYWTNKSIKTANDTLVEYILKHSHTFFINRFAGSISSKVGNVHNAFSEIVPDFLWALLSSLVTFIVTFAFIFNVNSLAASAFLGLLLVLILINQRFAPRKTQLAKENAEAGTLLQGSIVDVFSNAATVRQYVQNKTEFANIQKLTTNKFRAGLKNWLYTEKLLLINGAILSAFAVGIFWLLVTKWGQGDITTGDFILVVSLIYNITGSLLFVGRAFNAVSRTAGEMREGLEDILLPHDIVDSPKAKTLKAKEGEIVWDKVNFNFAENQVFKDFSLTIPSTQRIGLVGSSGAGKTTFVSLMLRQHELMGGKILIDGQDISLAKQDSLRTAIALVPQEPSLFHRTIRENIAYANPTASLQTVIAAAKKAQAHDFITKLPLGYDTIVGERGVKLSGGQKQRVAIARAILKNAPILILDEATSALDSESEHEIQKALHLLMSGKTVIAIAHRLSTLREMDRIIVLENGKIIEDGSHEALLAVGGHYANLWSHQAGGFIQE
ncbi:MAG TPA: ABC transporter ATP-binding protein [Candidatus Paceibacterota bacterium]|nr:ABC transporter ATP-binding protein [Candidatus Paceibacterota bacterium]